jgi:carboxyl-terminal processing protease
MSLFNVPALLRLGSAIAASLALSGCAALDWKSQPRDAVIAAAFERIDQVALEAPDFTRIGLVGAQGLSLIDPALDVEKQRDRLIVLFDGKLVEKLPAPAANDSLGWAAAVTRVASLGAQFSPAFAEVSPEEVQRAALAAAVSTLDAYSSYRGPARAFEEREQREGYGDIGVDWEEIREGFTARIVHAESPAARAGLQVGDRLTSIDRAAVTVSSLYGLARRLHGPPDSKVQIGIRRGETEMNFTVERKKFVAPTVTAYRDGALSYLRVASFNSGTAEQVEAQIRRLARTDGDGESRGLVIDLRGNAGGLLDQAVAVADLFLPAGQGILWTAGRHPGSFQTYQASGGDLIAGKPIAVLVDGRTASSAEVLAAALRDNGRALVIGTTTLGKGSVQTVTRMPNNGELLLTWSLMYGPKGLPIHRLGIVPGQCTGAAAADTRQEAGLLQAAAQGEATAIAAVRERCRATDEARPAPRGGPADADLALARRSLADPALFHALAEAGVPDLPPIPGRLQAAR